MILNNWWNYKKGLANSTGFWNSWNYQSPGLYDTSGNTTVMCIDATWNSSYCTMGHNNFSTRAYMHFAVGDGDTPPTSEDYALDNDITSSFSNVTISSVSTTATSENTTITYIITGTNSTSDTLTIREIGYVKDIYYSQSFNTVPVLMAREVLDEPIVVEPNQTFTINFTWTEA